MQIEADQRFPEVHKDSDSCCHEQNRQNDLQAEGPANSLIILLAAILGSKDPDSRQTSEKAQIPHK